MTTHTVRCGEFEGPTAVELVQGTTDLEVIDRQEVTVTRVVGQLSFAYQQYVVDPPTFSLPYIRMGLVTVESEISIGTWVPPDLWDRAELEETSFMWLRQLHMSDNLVQLGPFTIPGLAANVQVFHSSATVDVDCTINRKIGRDGHLMLVVSKHFGVIPNQGVLSPLVDMVQNLRVLVKC